MKAQRPKVWPCGKRAFTHWHTHTKKNGCGKLAARRLPADLPHEFSVDAHWTLWSFSSLLRSLKRPAFPLWNLYGNVGAVLSCCHVNVKKWPHFWTESLQIPSSSGTGIEAVFRYFAKKNCDGILLIWSTRWSLFTKFFAQMDCKSRDESNDVN